MNKNKFNKIFWANHSSPPLFAVNSPQKKLPDLSLKKGSDLSPFHPSDNPTNPSAYDTLHQLRFHPSDLTTQLCEIQILSVRWVTWRDLIIVNPEAQNCGPPQQKKRDLYKWVK